MSSSKLFRDFVVNVLVVLGYTLGAQSMRHSEVNVGVNLFSSVRLEIGV